MLLRCSRTSELMVKESVAPLALGGIASKALGAAKGAGKFLKNHWQGLLAGGTVLPTAGGTIQRAAQGMSEEAFNMRNAGLMPPGPPKVPKI